MRFKTFMKALPRSQRGGVHEHALQAAPSAGEERAA